VVEIYPGDPQAGSRWGYVMMGYCLRKRPRFDDDEPDYRGLPTMTIRYELGAVERAEIEQATIRLKRAEAPIRGAGSGVFAAWWSAETASSRPPRR
jgi:hypothetical protein